MDMDEALTLKARKRMIVNYLQGYENVVSVEAVPTESDSITINIGWEFPDGGGQTSLPVSNKRIMETSEGVLSKQIYDEHLAALRQGDDKSE